MCLRRGRIPVGADKNVTVDHTVPNMNFVTVAVSNNNLIAVNGNDNKVYKSAVGSKVWEIVPNKEIDTPEKLQKEYQKITQYENSDVDKNSQDYLMQRRINEPYSKSRQRSLLG